LALPLRAVRISGPMHSFQHLLDQHSPTVRDRGRSYQISGRVHELAVEAEWVTATVRGTEDYLVELRLTRGQWVDSCTCPAFEDRSACKHVCAVLYELMSGAPGGSAAARAATTRPGVRSADEASLRAEARAAAISRGARELKRLESLPSLAREAQLMRETLRKLGFDAPVPVESESRRAERLLTALSKSDHSQPPERRQTHLRYMLSRSSEDASVVRVEIEAARESTRGELGVYRSVRNGFDVETLDATDRLAHSVISSAPLDFEHAFGANANQWLLDATLQDLILPQLARAGRLLFKREETASARALVADRPEPFMFGLAVKRDIRGFEIEGFLTRGAERVLLHKVDLALAGGFAILGDRFVSAQWRGASEWAAALCREAPFRIGAARSSDLARILAEAPAGLNLHAEGMVETVGGTPTPVLELRLADDSAQRILACIRFEYGTIRLRLDEPSVSMKGERVVRVERDSAAESAAVAQFEAAGGRLRALRREEFDGDFAREALSSVVQSLAALGWIVEGDGVKLRSESKFDIGVTSGLDWFDVHAEVTFDGEHVGLPALLEALAKKRPLVRLADGSLGIVPKSITDRWQALALLGRVDGDHVHVKRSNGFLLDVMLDERMNARADVGFTELRRKLAGAHAVAPRLETAGFHGELRPYQRDGLGWLSFLGETGLGGVLADDMGLGKTVQVLAWILCRIKSPRGRTLVVAPNSLIFNWRREAERFAPSLSVHVHHGPSRARSKAQLEDADLVLTTYGTMRQDVKWLSSIRFDLVVADEAQALKNPKSQVAKAARLLEADQRIALTGTPIENRVGDVLSIFEFLNPGLLEGSRALRHLLDGADEIETARLAARALGPFMLRRKKEDVLKDLPEKTEQIVMCELEGTQRREYDVLRDHYRRALLNEVDEVGIDAARMNVLTALLRLRQAACHLALIHADHEKTPSAKLVTLLDMLDELRASGHKALVFSQFTSFLALVKTALDARSVPYSYLDGKTTKREGVVEKFQSDSATSVFLISLKAGGVGLNLTAADYVFLLDPWWNPAVERQAIDRTHRIGQTRAVTAYRLVARDTVEEKVLELQERKKALAEALFEGAGTSLAQLTRDDLVNILS